MTSRRSMAAEQAVPRRHRAPGTASRSRLGQRLHRPQLPRQPSACLRFAFSRQHRGRASRRSTSAASSRTSPTSSCSTGSSRVERTWRNICAVRNVSDFKTVTSYRLIGADQYEQVAPGGELKHGTLGNESYSNKADTYGLMLVDRPPRHHQRRPRRDHHGPAQARPRLGPEDQRRLLDDLPEQRRHSSPPATRTTSAAPTRH